jgi:hypothetical protein
MIDINGSYEAVSLTDEECESINHVVKNWVAEEKGATVEDKRYRLPKLRNYLNYCVDYVMDNLPDGITRVDGGCIQPLMLAEIQAQIDLLPVEEPIEV